MNASILKKKKISPANIKQAKIEIADNINKAAAFYDSELKDKNILIITEEDVFEFGFDKGNFAHLCGVSSYFPDWQFYALSTKGKFKPSKIKFSQGQHLSSAYEKMQVLPNLLKAIREGSDKVRIIKDVETDTRLYSVGICLNDNPPGALLFGSDDDKKINAPISTRFKKMENFDYDMECKIKYILIKNKNKKRYSELLLGDVDDFKKYINEVPSLKLSVDTKNIKTPIKTKKEKKTMTIKSKHANVKENNINIGEVVNLVTKKHNSSLERLGMELPEQKFEKDDIIFIHDTMIKDYGGIYGVRDEGLLDASVSNPYQSVFGEDLYPTVYDKAAKYLFDFAHYQIFNDGNKRTGLATMEAYLIANGYDFIMDAKTQYQFVMDIANNKYVEIPDIAKIIEENTIFLPKKDINFFNDDIIYNDNKDITGNEDQNYERE